MMSFQKDMYNCINEPCSVVFMNDSGVCLCSQGWDITVIYFQGTGTGCLRSESLELARTYVLVWKMEYMPLRSAKSAGYSSSVSIETGWRANAIFRAISACSKPTSGPNVVLKSSGAPAQSLPWVPGDTSKVKSNRKKPTYQQEYL